MSRDQGGRVEGPETRVWCPHAHRVDGGSGWGGGDPRAVESPRSFYSAPGGRATGSTGPVWHGLPVVGSHQTLEVLNEYSQLKKKSSDLKKNYGAGQT